MDSSAKDSEYNEIWEHRSASYEEFRSNVFVISGVLYGVHEAFRNLNARDSVFEKILSVYLSGMIYGGIAHMMERVLPMGDAKWVTPVVVVIRLGFGLGQLLVQE